MECSLCEACSDADPEIKLSFGGNEFIFYIESWGQLSCKEIFNEAIKIFDEKLDEFSDSIKSMA